MATIGSATRSSEEMAKLVECGISIARFDLTFQTEVVGRHSVGINMCAGDQHVWVRQHAKLGKGRGTRYQYFKGSKCTL